MTLLQNAELFEYQSLLTYYGILNTGILSESDLDYLAFRLKIISTSQNAPHAQLLIESTMSQQSTPPIAPPTDTSLTDWPTASFSDALAFHICDFYDAMSPCWNCRCELWEGVNDTQIQSWMWEDNKSCSPDYMIQKHVEGLRAGVAGVVPLVDQVGVQFKHQDNGPMDELGTLLS